MKIKVCGMREPENLAQALQLPIDYVGFIFYPGSKRYVGDHPELKTWLLENESAFGKVKKVGVFVNTGIDDLLNAVHDYQLDLVQLHGDESPEYCRELELLWRVSSVRKAGISKAFSIDDNFSFSTTEPYIPYCRHFVFDTKGAGYGGTGKKFDWSKLHAYTGSTPFLLSGGIGPDDHAAVKKMTHPQLLGLDLNSQFETEPGKKNVEKLSSFLQALEA